MPKLRRHRRKARFRNRPDGVRHRELLVDPAAVPTSYRVVAYSPNSLQELRQPSLAAVEELRGRSSVVWVDVAGLADIELIKKIGAAFNIHPLVLEDIVRTHQRAKLEEYDDALFIVSRMAPQGGQEETEQLAIYMTGNVLLTFQEIPGDDFDPVRNRLRMNKGRIRNEGTDYLAYALLDAVIDAYFPLVDHYGEMIEELEDRLVLSPVKSLLAEIYNVRRKLLELRRALWPHRELLAALYRGDLPLISRDNQVFFRDCYDHTVQLADLMENFRELTSNLMDVYLSSSSNRLNEIMKVLTIISAIFIPLTFIVGVYGMNFRTDVSPWNMPELTAYYGYPVCLALMAFIAVAQVVYFWRKGWLWERERSQAMRNKGQ